MLIAQQMMQAQAEAMMVDHVSLWQNDAEIWDGPGLLETYNERMVGVSFISGGPTLHQTYTAYLPLSAPLRWASLLVIESRNPRLVGLRLQFQAAPRDTFGVYSRFWVNAPT